MEVGQAALGGLLGGGAMVVVLYTMRAMMPAQMRMDLLLLIGSMLVPIVLARRTSIRSDRMMRDQGPVLGIA